MRLLPLLLLFACSAQGSAGPSAEAERLDSASTVAGLGTVASPPASAASSRAAATPGAPAPGEPTAGASTADGTASTAAAPGTVGPGASTPNPPSPAELRPASALAAAVGTANAAPITTVSGAEGQTARRPGHASVPTLPMPGSGRRLPAPTVAEALNATVLATLGTYPLGEANPYDWHRGVNTDGVSRDLFWRGVPLAAAGGDGGVHCSGITWEVYLRSLTAAVGDGAGPSGEDLLAAKDTWYVRTEDEAGPVGALVGHGLGVIPADVAALQPGDFIQFWRNNGKGHSAIFLSHRFNADGTIRGLVYWSAQGSSGGIGRRIISFGEDVNQVNRIYAVRAVKPG